MPLLDGDLESSEKPPSRKVRLPSSQLLPAHQRCRGGRTRSAEVRESLLLPAPLVAAEPTLSLQASPLSLPFPQGSSLVPGCPKAGRGDAEELTLTSAPRVPEMLTGREEMEIREKRVMEPGCLSSLQTGVPPPASAATFPSPTPAPSPQVLLCLSSSFHLFLSSRSPTFSPLPRVHFSCSRSVEGRQPEACVSWDGWGGCGRNREVEAACGGGECGAEGWWEAQGSCLCGERCRRRLESRGW